MALSATKTQRNRGVIVSDDSAPGNGRLPRTQVGTTPQHLLMTLLGHYWFGRAEHLPSAALVELLAEFDISTPSARAALNRLTKRGLLVSSKRGRNTYYGLTPGVTPARRGNAPTDRHLRGPGRPDLGRRVDDGRLLRAGSAA